MEYRVTYSGFVASACCHSAFACISEMKMDLAITLIAVPAVKGRYHQAAIYLSGYIGFLIISHSRIQGSKEQDGISL